MVKIGQRKDKSQPRKYLKRTPMKRSIKSPRKVGAVSRAAIKEAVKKAPPQRSTLKSRIDPLDTLFSLVIRTRSKGYCEFCGKYIGVENLDTCHDIGRANRQTRWDIDNALAGCRESHEYYDNHAQEKHDFFRVRIGDERYEALQVRANRSDKADRDAIKIFLNALLTPSGVVC